MGARALTLRRGAGSAASLVLVLGVLAACSGGKAKSAASTTTAADIQSTIGISTTSPTSSSTTTTLPSGCDAGPLPSSAIRISRAAGDFNGDGTPDTLVVYGTGNDITPSPYVVRVELGRGAGTVETPIVDAATDPNQNVKALGSAEISARAGLPADGSGAEAFVAVGSGASTFLVGIYQLTACRLVRLTGSSGMTPAALPVGGTVTHLSGLRCDGIAGGTRLVRVAAESTDGVTYDTSEQPLDVTDGKLVPPGPPVKGTLSVNDPALPRFGGLDCAGVDAA
ncbi:MAG: hypothetical protein QOF97_1297 [Acidimicrobiaceae bacterium]